MQAALEAVLGILYGIEGLSPSGEGEQGEKETKRAQQIRRRLHALHRAVCLAKFVVLTGLAILALTGEVH